LHGNRARPRKVRRPVTIAGRIIFYVAFRALRTCFPWDGEVTAYADTRDEPSQEPFQGWLDAAGEALRRAGLTKDAGRRRSASSR